MKFMRHEDLILAAAVESLRGQDLAQADPVHVETWLSGILLALDAIGAEL